MKLTTNCQQCNRPLVETSTLVLDQTTLHFHKCGHITTTQKMQWHNGHLDTFSLDGMRQARNYQLEGIDFIYNTDVNCLCTDQVGLGKTMQALSVYRNSKQLLGKCLIVVKSATLWQWVNQYKLWCDNGLFGCYIIQGTKGIIPPGFDTYIISMDTFGRMVRINNKHDSMYDKALTYVTEPTSYGAKDAIKIIVDPRLKMVLGENPFLIVDECQSFKDPSSNRTKALVGFIKEMGISHKLFLSATPVKNRADEFFITLNLLQPEKFPSLDKFRRDWLVRDDKNKWSRVSPYRLEEFRKMLDSFVIRRETRDVLPDLPPFRREFEIVYIEDENLKKIYNEEVKKLQEKYQSKSSVSWLDVQVNMMTLRRITGMAKVQFAIEYVDTFLDTSENEKIAIGIHHEGVRDILFQMLTEKGFNPLKLSGEDNAQHKMEIVQEFRKPERRVLIINMLAGGVGIDGLEVCNNIIGLERQWNSVDEEQFEGRFAGARQAQSGLPVYCEYWIAKDTIDEDFHNMIEQKRQMIHEVTDNNWSLESDPVLLRDLIERTISRPKL